MNLSVIPINDAAINIPIYLEPALLLKCYAKGLLNVILNLSLDKTLLIQTFP